MTDPVLLEILKEIGIDYNPWELEPKIGYWYTVCCELDLDEINNKEDLDVVKGYKEEKGGFENMVRVWKTKEDALKHLLNKELHPEYQH